jgi:hypothetical protein
MNAIAYQGNQGKQRGEDMAQVAPTKPHQCKGCIHHLVLSRLRLVTTSLTTAGSVITTHCNGPTTKHSNLKCPYVCVRVSPHIDKAVCIYCIIINMIYMKRLRYFRHRNLGKIQSGSALQVQACSLTRYSSIGFLRYEHEAPTKPASYCNWCHISEPISMLERASI